MDLVDKTVMETVKKPRGRPPNGDEKVRATSRERTAKHRASLPLEKKLMNNAKNRERMRSKRATEDAEARKVRMERTNVLTRKRRLLQRVGNFCRSRFENLCLSAGIVKSITDEFWLVLTTRYSEPHRAYHTLVHIYDLLQRFDRCEEYFSDNYQIKAAVQWAIYYHDVIYDPTSRSNEEDSAALFEEHCQAYLPSAMVEKVSSYILATKSHNDSAHNTTDHDLKLFLDLDLSILASSRERYIQYTAEIRTEYKFFSKEDYCAGRRKVLESFLGKDREHKRIYASDELCKLWEGAARENLLWEISQLEQGLVPF